MYSKLTDCNQWDPNLWAKECLFEWNQMFSLQRYCLELWWFLRGFYHLATSVTLKWDSHPNRDFGFYIQWLSIFSVWSGSRNKIHVLAFNWKLVSGGRMESSEEWLSATDEIWMNPQSRCNKTPISPQLD